MVLIARTSLLSLPSMHHRESQAALYRYQERSKEDSATYQYIHSPLRRTTVAGAAQIHYIELPSMLGWGERLLARLIAKPWCRR